MNLSLTKSAAAAAMLVAWGAAPAATFNETEPNNTLANAQVITDPGSTLTVINGTRTSADTTDDFYRFTVTAPGALQITSSSPNAFADSVMGLFGPSGTLLASNDDAGPGSSMSAITFEAATAGTYTLGFSGFDFGLLSCTAAVTNCYDRNGDFEFDTFVAGGGEDSSTGWTYAITINQVAAIPEPETVLLFGLGVAMVPWLRRRAARAAQRRG